MYVQALGVTERAQVAVWSGVISGSAALTMAVLAPVWGVLAGAAFVGLLPTISADVPLIGSTHGQDVVFGLIVILVMLALPNGVAGLAARLARLRRA